MFPARNGLDMSYNYTIAQSPLMGKDIVGAFVTSAKAKSIGHGFYYSSVVNNFLNVQLGKVRPEPLSDGQVGISDETYDKIVFDQLTELWTEYGALTEIWFDGGYTGSQRGKIQSLLEQYQPQAVIIIGCQEDGTCVSGNSVRWIGTEEGHAPEENWSTGITNDGGASDSPDFCPSACDTTLQWPKRWFWGADASIRSLKEMIDVYHRTVGRNCMLELDLSPGRDGLVTPAHVERYRGLGDFIKTCYGNPVTPTNVIKECGAGVYAMKFDKPVSIDRIQLMEDQSDGQVIRTYGVYAKLAGVEQDGWTLVSDGTSVGHKTIDIFDNVIKVDAIKVNSTYVDTPKWRPASVHLCDQY
ncbi:hypothetical protein K4F52_005285 [Lecanicillium sp. MT-2017a]|nr:hypothetical protein K4F52_005285 [Lecanicillium sp. MT-2017a]